MLILLNKSFKVILLVKMV